MTARERLLAFYRHESDGRIPLAAYDTLLPRGNVERMLRNQGLGLLKTCPVSNLISPSYIKRACGPIANVEVTLRETVEDGELTTVRTFETPVGRVFEKYRKDREYGTMWIKKYLIEEPADYPVVRFIVQNSVLSEQVAAYRLACNDLGDDGLVLALVDRTPFQKVLWELTGPERLLFDLHDNRSMVEDLLKAIESQLDVAYAFASTSPAEVIWSSDNLTGDICSPSIYRAYHLGYYRRWARLLHEAGKVYAVHMDGRLRSLCDAIGETPVDVIESFSLPMAGGDLPIVDALNAWKGKSIAMNLPASLCYKEERHVGTFVSDLLAALHGKGACMLQISENLPPAAWQKCLSFVVDAANRG
jgi:hypothetical protein